MLLSEAKEILMQNGYIVESSVKGDFVKGERGGEKYKELSNDYTYDDARRFFIAAIYGESVANDPEQLENRWNTYLTKSRKNQFEKTYAAFEKIKAAGKAKLYRGVVVNKNKEIDTEHAGVCWSFSSSLPRKWVEGIWDNMVYNHVVNRSELEDCHKVIFSATTSVDNMLLPYSFWLAGRFERPEWEIRLKDENAVSNITKRFIDEE